MSSIQSNTSSLVAGTVTETEERDRRRRETNRKSSAAAYQRNKDKISATAVVVASSHCPLVRRLQAIDCLSDVNHVDTFIRHCLLPTTNNAELSFCDIVEAYKYWCEQEGVTQRHNIFELSASLTRVLGLTSTGARQGVSTEQGRLLC